MNDLSFSDFAVQEGGGTLSDGGEFVKINKTSGANLFVMAGYKNSAYYLTPVLSNTTYTISYTLRKSSNFVPQSGKHIIMRYRLNQNDVTNNLGELILDSTNVNDEFTTYTKTFTTGALVNPNSYYFQVLVEEGLSGEIELSYEIKLERGSTATPYQPNLLDAPYYLSKVPLGENIADPTKTFPIKTRAYLVYSGTNTEPYIAGQQYTITMKATKPATQVFNVFLNAGTIGFGTMTPVEGLTDVWQKRVTVSQDLIDAGLKDRLTIYQVPNSSVGDVQIEWLKIEKGNTRTPNIPYYKYEGIAPAPSNNPNDYHWGYSPSYINAVEYVSSGDSVGDLIKIENNGTYRTKPRFSFRMKGENGLVALLNQNGAILQFGNPEDVDGTTSSRVEPALNETFWGKTLNPALKVNTGFKSVYPNLHGSPATPNRIQGSWNMKDDPDAVQPVYTGVGDINVWHGPTIMADIAAPSNTDRTLPISTHFRFGFDNYNKGQRGRIEFANFDENGNPIMTAIIRDSTTASNELVFEAWYKNKKLHEKKLDRKVFSKSFYEMNMDRRGNRLVWRVVQIKSLNQAPGGWSDRKSVV